MARTIGGILAEARTLLQDKDPAPALRYTDGEMLEAVNGALLEARAKRPDLFLQLGLRSPVPSFTVADLAQPFPLNEGAYNAVVYYVVGRCELREDNFVSDGRAVTMMNKFVSQLLQVAS